MIIDDEENNTDETEDLSSYFSVSDNRENLEEPKKYRSLIVSVLATSLMIVLIVWLYRGQGVSLDKKAPIQDVIANIESSALHEETAENTELSKKDEETLLSKREAQQSYFLKSLKQKLKKRVDGDSGNAEGSENVGNAEGSESSGKTKEDIIKKENSREPTKAELIKKNTELEKNILELKKSILDKQDKNNSFTERPNTEISSQKRKSDIETLQSSVEELNRKTEYYYKVQLAAYNKLEQAEFLWSQLLEEFPSWLDGLEPQYDISDSGLYRLRAGYYNQKIGAESLCSQLQDVNRSCLVISFPKN